MKKCSKCLIEQSLDNFWHNGKLGYHTICKDCQKIRRRKLGKKFCVCKVCGILFIENHKGQKCCSVGHQNKLTSDKHKIKEKENIEEFRSYFYLNKLWLAEPYRIRKGYGDKKDYSYAIFKYVVIPEHRLIMMRKLGRELKTWEHTHHINGIKSDNREENLVLIGRRQHFTVTMAMEENKKLRDRVFILEEEVRNLKAKYKLQEVF